MTNVSIGRTQLGAQLWLEPTDSKERVDALVAAAHGAGLGWLRVFLMWPWIEAEPGKWDFRVFDRAFDAAAAKGIRIKATLTANSGPWHIGTPSMLHSHTGFLSVEQCPAMQRYIEACATRYAKHPALGQWILWNEPTNGSDRVEESLAFWRSFLQQRYNGDLVALNTRWRTGYTSFDQIPFAEDIAHPVNQLHAPSAHRKSHWNSFRPWLDDWKMRAHWLASEIRWVSDTLRRFDATTPTCINPVPLLDNNPLAGVDLNVLGQIVDVVGASYHPSWNFTYARRAQFPALMASGVSLQRSVPCIKRVEVTEVQTGNTFSSSNRPNDVTPGELAQFFLAGLAAGAESVTGWCLNVRTQDNEAGDWALLDDQDQPSRRSKMLAKVEQTLTETYGITGKWTPATPQVYVVKDLHSEALEWVETLAMPHVPGRHPQAGARGTALLSAAAQQHGAAVSLVQLGDLPANGADKTAIVSHIGCWSEEDGQRLVTFVESGGTLVLDGISGRKTPDDAMHRPWPGVLGQRWGFGGKELQSKWDHYPLRLHGLPAGPWLTCRTLWEFANPEAWTAWSPLRFATDGEPCVRSSVQGKGRLVLVSGLLGASLIDASDAGYAVVHALLDHVLQGTVRPVQADVGGAAVTVLPVAAENGKLWVVLNSGLQEGGARNFRLQLAAGAYRDLWSGATWQLAHRTDLEFDPADGIVLLFQA